MKREARTIGESNHRGVAFEEILKLREENSKRARLSERGGRELRHFDEGGACELKARLVGIRLNSTRTRSRERLDAQIQIVGTFRFTRSKTVQRPLGLDS